MHNIEMRSVNADVFWGFGPPGFPDHFDSLRITGALAIGEEGEVDEIYRLVAEKRKGVGETIAQASVIHMQDIEHVETLMAGILKSHLHGDQFDFDSTLPHGTSHFWTLNPSNPELEPCDHNTISIKQETRETKKAVVIELREPDTEDSDCMIATGRVDITLMDQTGKNFVNTVSNFIRRAKSLRDELSEEARYSPAP